MKSKSRRWNEERLRGKRETKTKSMIRARETRFVILLGHDARGLVVRKEKIFEHE